MAKAMEFAQFTANNATLAVSDATLLIELPVVEGAAHDSPAAKQAMTARLYFYKEDSRVLITYRPAIAPDADRDAEEEVQDTPSKPTAVANIEEENEEGADVELVEDEPAISRGRGRVWLATITNVIFNAEMLTMMTVKLPGDDSVRMLLDDLRDANILEKQISVEVMPDPSSGYESRIRAFANNRLTACLVNPILTRVDKTPCKEMMSALLGIGDAVTNSQTTPEELQTTTVGGFPLDEEQKRLIAQTREPGVQAVVVNALAGWLCLSFYSIFNNAKIKLSLKTMLFELGICPICSYLIVSRHAGNR